MEEYMLPCFNKKLFGFDCPGCGAQRSMYLLSQGEFVSAFKMFPAVYTTVLLFAIIGLHFVDRSRNYHKAMIFMAVLNAAITVIAYIYKIVTNF